MSRPTTFPATLRTLTAAAVGIALNVTAASAQNPFESLGLTSASVTYGPYLRLEAGMARPDLDDAYWLPPGYPSDPEISFSLDADDVASGSIAFGFDWQNGWRVDMASIFRTGDSDVSGQCSGASDGSDCDDPVEGHADITAAPLQTRAIMANAFYAPLEAKGSNSVFQPFVTAGIGVARNEVGDWTRENTATGAGREFRTFEGDSTSGLAWSVGAGAALQVTRPGKWPVIVELGWRYYDLGEARGGSTPLPGNGSGQPVQPLTFDVTEHVLSVGIRIPLQRY